MQPITQNKKRIKIQHIIGGGSAQVNITRNVQLPAIIRKVVDIHAEIIELDYEIIPNKVIIKGALHKQIYYVEEGDYVVKEFTIMREEFTDFIHIPGATPQMEVMLDGHVLFVDTNPANGAYPTDTIYQAAVLAVDVQVVELMTLDVVTDVHGEGICCKKELFSVECLIGAAEKQTTVAVEHILCKPARKVYDMDAVCRDVDYEILPNKVIIRGTLHKQVYYVDAEDDTVQEQSYDNEFSVVVDIPGARPEMEVYTKCRVEFCEAKLIGAPPSTMVKVNCILQIFVKVTELVQMNIVTEVTGCMVDRCRIRVEDVMGKKCHQENINQSIDVNYPADVNGVLVKKAKNMHAEIRNVTYEKILNKVIIKGLIHVQVYYVSCNNCEQELRETSSDIPFTTFVHFDGVNEDTLIRVKERVEYTDAKVDGVPCETSIVRAVAILEVCVRAYQVRDFMVVVDCKHHENIPVPPMTPPCAMPPPRPQPMPEPPPRPMPKPEPPPRPQPTPEPPPRPQPEPEVCPPDGYKHVVQQGDTLAKIATKFQGKVPGLSWQQIATFNHMYAPYALTIGQVVRIPCVAGKG